MHSQLVSIYKPLYSLERKLNKESSLYSEFKFLTVFSRCLAVNTYKKKNNHSSYIKSFNPLTSCCVHATHIHLPDVMTILNI